jgi:hypothetical protein
MYSIRLFIVVSLIVLAGCSTLRTGYDYDAAFNFAGLRTYDWAPDAKPSSGDPVIDTDTLLEQRVHEAVERELQSKGYRKETSKQPDFWIAYRVSVRSRTDMSTLNPWYGYYGWGGGAWGGWGMGGYYPWPYTGGYLREYDQGILTLDAIDPKTRKLIWRGTAMDYINLTDSPQEKTRRIQESVQGLLEKFPPTAA